MDTPAPSARTNNKSLIWLSIVLVIALVAAFLWWWNYRKYISTDDANLDTFRVNVAAQVMAPLVTLYVHEGDSVRRGMLLATLDSTLVTTRLQEALATSASASVESLRVEQGYYRIVAPVDGIIAKCWSLPGDVVQPGQTIFTINEGKEIWVSVYLDETKFSSLRLGQEAQFTLDAYQGVTFYGKIFYIGANTASQFSLIPPNNASGNYTKIAQRIPLKVSIDRMEGKGKAHVKLISGMSASLKIKKEN